MPPELSVVVPTYNRCGLLPGLLEALQAQDLPKERFEVIIVDNNSTDGTWAYLSGLSIPWLKAFREEKPGAAAARNRGLAQARAPVLHFLDDDMAPAPDCLRRHLEASREGPERSYVGFIDFRWEKYRSPLCRYLAEVSAATLFPPAGQETDFYHFYTANVSAPKSAILNVGGFSEKFKGYGYEDAELGYRLFLAGVSLYYLAGAVCTNRLPPCPAEYWRKLEWQGAAQWQFLQLHPELGSLDRSKARIARIGPVLNLYKRCGWIIDRLASRSSVDKPLPRWVRLHYRFFSACLIQTGFTAAAADLAAPEKRAPSSP